ncbi:DUF6119 family protein [Streptomyces angustmyceticus]|uniref:DUF6119 family protein n=1 Tax=Streptomyces angustmyceticus TaxID=285578 RepID=UPI0021B072D2|nr:DUF6119 family protein [Streptomyces angustmyceticus]
MKLTINLAHKDVVGFDGLIRPVYLEMDNGLEALQPTNSLGFPLQAYIQRDKPTQPKWLDFLGSHFAVSQIQNLSTSFVLLAKAHDRIFAITFGMSGFNALDRTKFEREFGLRVCANSVDEDDLTTVDTRNLDTVTRQQRTHLSSGSRLSDFSIPLEQDWIRRIQGKTATLDFAKSISGSDSLHININVPLTGLPDVLGTLLERFNSNEYKKRFPFLDYYRPLEDESEITKTLNSLLDARINERSLDKLSLALPQLIDDEQVNHFDLSARYKRAELDEITLSNVYTFIDEYYEGSTPLSEVKIVPVADTGQPAGQKRPLRDWIVCEFDESESTYVLSLGNWYEVNRDYVQEVNAGVDRLADISHELNMDMWNPAEGEGGYNERVSKDEDWLLLDKDNFHIGGPHQKIEICDLMTKDMKLICVKQQTSSATLSHLFSQGSVSAELYRGEESYRDRIFQNAREKWGEGIEEPNGGPMIVYAIANDRDQPLAETLFFFSKISLLFNARIVQRLGMQVALARIPMPKGSLRKKKRKSKRRDA